jgi:hypothetical protein
LASGKWVMQNSKLRELKHRKQQVFIAKKLL